MTDEVLNLRNVGARQCRQTDHGFEVMSQIRMAPGSRSADFEGGIAKTAWRGHTTEGPSGHNALFVEFAFSHPSNI
jgi:hypothetical protein